MRLKNTKGKKVHTEPEVKFNGPKVKASRKLGIPLTDKASRYMEKRNTLPGQHGMKRRRRPSNYGRQLLEKQRLRYQYNVSEKQLRNYFKKAARQKGVTGENLVRILESRLDASVLRAGFAPTIYAARQVVGHGHIKVNGRKVDVPSYRVRVGDEVEIKDKSKKLRIFNESRGASVPGYISVDSSGYKAEITAVPNREEVPVVCEVPLVVEFYSR